MRNTMWIYAAIILWVSETWSIEPGTNQSTPVNSSTTLQPKVYVAKNLSFNLGSDVILKCSNKTWKEMMFVIWEIHLKDKDCKIAFNNDGRSQNNCTDDKSLQNTSDSQSYLRIPNFSANDPGLYKCESVYSGGIENYEINVSITVPPSKVSGWSVEKDNKIIAVCIAERGKPAATISWSHMGNSSSVYKQDSDGFVTVESYLELPKGMDTKNLSCAIRHQFWENDTIVEVKPREGYFPWLYIPIVVVIFVFLVGLFIFAQKKLVLLRQCRQSNNSPSKSSPTEDVEEVEPYASYVQRVNSIYNSSADFFSRKNSAHASHAHI